MMIDEIDNDEIIFSTDTMVASFRDDVDGITDTDSGVEFDWDEIETVRIDDPPWIEAFETDEFYRIPTTVAKPIPQRYRYGQDTMMLMKPREELKRSIWSLDNKPWTLGHPDGKLVRNVDDIHGFWDDSYYVDSLDEANSYLHVPINDDEGKQYIEENQDVSMGFTHRIVSARMYDGIVGGDSDETSVDGFQTSIYFDHVASVQKGRCSSEQGCGLEMNNMVSVHADDDHENEYNDNPETTHVTVPDQVGDGSHVVVASARHTSKTYWTCVHVEGTEYQQPDGPDLSSSYGELGPFQPGDAPPHSIMLDEELDHGQEFYVSLHEDDDGEKGEHIRDAADNFIFDSSTYETVDGFENESENQDDDTNASYDHDPFIDSHVSQEGVTFHEAKDGSFISETTITYDYRDDEGTYYAVAPDENPDGTPKYPITSCTGSDSVESAWKLRNHGDINISVDTLEERIRRRASQLDCDLELETNDEDDIMSDKDTQTCTDCNSDVSIDVSDMSLEFIRGQHEAVDSELTELASAVDEKEEKISDLTEQIDEQEETIDSLKETVDSYESEVRDELIGDILDVTDHWDEEELESVEAIDELEDRYELAVELSADTSTVSGSGDGKGDSTQFEKPRRNTPWDDN